MRKIPTFFWEYEGHTPPEINKDTYRFHIKGAVQKPLVLSLDQLDALLPSVEVKRRFYCVNGWSLESIWRGYQLSDLLEVVQPDTTSTYLRTTSCGGYEDTTKISDLLQGEALLVTHMNGEPLTPERGSPIRLIIFNMYQFKGVKQVNVIEVVQDYRPGTWQKVGYQDATIQPDPHFAIERNEEIMPEEKILIESLNHS